MISPKVVQEIKEGRGSPSHAAEVLEAYEGLLGGVKTLRAYLLGFDWCGETIASKFLAEYGVGDKEELINGG